MTDETTVGLQIVDGGAEVPTVESTEGGEPTEDEATAAAEKPTDEKIWGFITIPIVDGTELRAHCKQIGRSMRDVQNEAFAACWPALHATIYADKEARDVARAAVKNLPKSPEKLAEKQAALEAKARAIEAKLAQVRAMLSGDSDTGAVDALPPVADEPESEDGANLTDLLPTEFTASDGDEPETSGDASVAGSGDGAEFEPEVGRSGRSSSRRNR